MYANAQRWVFRAALNDSNESLEVTETDNAFQTVAAACTKVQSPATVRDLIDLCVPFKNLLLLKEG